MKTIIIALLSFSVNTASALETDGIFWQQYFWQGPKQWKLRPYVEVQTRLGDQFSRVQHLLFRPAVLYALSDQTSVWLGYGWTPTFNFNTTAFGDEQRFWQQFTHTFHLTERSSLTTRTRIEERILPSATGVGLRLRELIRYHLAFDDEKIWQLVIWDELFWQLNTVTSSVIAGYNQNRVLIGAYIQLSQNLYLEAGYLSIITRQAPPLDTKLSHGPLIAIYTSL